MSNKPSQEEINNYLQIREQYKQNYLAKRQQKIAAIQQKHQLDLKLYQQQVYNNTRSFEDYLHFQFGQGNTKQLKRRFLQNTNDLNNIYDWLKNNSTRR
jgi:hypothetical protein